MFKAEIEEDALLAAAGADADRHGNSRNNLQSAGKVVCPPNARVQEELVAPLVAAGTENVLGANKDRFQERIEARAYRPYQAVVGVVGVCCRLITIGILAVRHYRRAKVPMRGQLLVHDHAHGPVGLETHATDAATL